MRKHPYALALAFGLASWLLLSGRAAQAREVPPPEGPTMGELQLDPASADADAGPAVFTGLIVTETVGLSPNVCATTTAITVPAGTLVTLCYRLYNDSGSLLNTHNLHDTLTDGLLNDTYLGLPQGSSTTLTRTIVATSSVLNLAVWSVTQPITSYTVSLGTCPTFPDLSGSGQALHLGDDAMVNVTMPFYFQLYDRFSNRLRVSNNGAVLLDEPNGGVSFSNSALPTAGLPHGLALFWDDLDSATGEVYVGLKTFLAAELAGGEAAALDPQATYNYYVIEYWQRSLFPGPTNAGTFALLLAAPGQGIDGTVSMCYQDTGFGDAGHDFGASATIGLNHNGSVADTYSFNTAHPALTGTAGLDFEPVGGSHAAFVSSASARLNVITKVNLPIVTR